MEGKIQTADCGLQTADCRVSIRVKTNLQGYGNFLIIFGQC